MSTVLQVENINVYYGSIHAVKDVSFHVEQGEVVTLIGANGAGKSTTLNTVAVCCTAERAACALWARSCAMCPATSWWGAAWRWYRRDGAFSST